MSEHAAEAIRAVYAQVRAPQWAAANLDALTDVLRDLSWLPPGPVPVHVSADAPDRVRRVLALAVEESAGTEHPVHLRPPDAGG